MVQELDPRFMQNGKYCIIAHMTAIVYISYTNGYVCGVIELPGKVNVDSWHRYVSGKIKEGKSVAVILKGIDKIEDIHKVVRGGDKRRGSDFFSPFFHLVIAIFILFFTTYTTK